MVKQDFMKPKEDLKDIAKSILEISKATETEVLIFKSQNALTRFANNEIHQNMAWSDTSLSVRVIFDKKIGVASTNSFDEKSLEAVLAKATKLAKLQNEDPDFMSLPSNKESIFDKNKMEDKIEQDFYKSADAKYRADAVGQIINLAKDNRLTASGAFSQEYTQIGVYNSCGVSKAHASSSANLSTVVMGESSSGFAAQVSKNIKDIDAVTAGKTAVNKAIESANPQDIDPGEYEIILEPQAVSEMLAFLQWYGPNARIYHEDASCFSGKMNQRVFGENVTLVDDPFHELVFPMPFDYEGYPKEKITIVESGILKNIVYDSYFANKFGQKNTGHALPAPNTLGPVPLHMYIAPGKKTREQMIKNVKKGLLVTRLWYVRVLNPKLLNITGMTRDGTFLIENGQIKHAVKNLRFNQSIPEALNNVIDIENKLTPLASFEGEFVALAPTVHIGRWFFSSKTVF
jgi:PmbA protein